MSYGMLSHVHFNFQNSFGTLQVSSLEAAPVSNVTLALNKEQLVENNMYNRTGESPYHEGTNVIEGGITMDAHPYGMGFLLKSVFGQVATSGAGTFTHVFVPRAVDFDVRAAMHPLTVQVDYDQGCSTIFHSLCGNNLTMEIANGEMLNLSVDYIGAGFAQDVVPIAPTFQDSDPFEWDQVSASYNGEAEVDFKSLSITLNNNLSAKHTLSNSKFPHKIRRDGAYQVTVNGTMTFESHSYWDAFEGQLEVPLTVTFKGNASPDEFKIEIPKLRLTAFAPQITGQGENEVTFDGVGIYDVGSGAAVICTLVNCQPFY